MRVLIALDINDTDIEEGDFTLSELDSGLGARLSAFYADSSYTGANHEVRAQVHAVADVSECWTLLVNGLEVTAETEPETTGETSIAHDALWTVKEILDEADDERDRYHAVAGE